MAKIGSAVVAVLCTAAPAWAEVEISMHVDRDKVGTEDVFRLEVSVANAPQGAELSLPHSDDFEILSRSQSSQMSLSMGSGSTAFTQIQKHVLTLRANRPGTLTISPAVLEVAGKQYKTQPVTMEVVKGRLHKAAPQQRAPFNPFGLPPGFPGLDEEEEALPSGPDIEEPIAPKGEADLFLRMSADKTDVYVGEQVMLSIHLYSRLDLSSVDTVTMPKLEGFWSQDFKTPNQLMAEQRIVNGVPYREYLLRQKAVFPLKPGPITIEAPEADITSGIFYASRRLHRKGNELKLTVKPLPPGPSTTAVGRWRLSRTVSQTQVALGEPLQIKLTLEGRGNLQSVSLPALGAPAAFKTFDPETSEKPATSKTHVGGTRAVEYTLVPQQTGTFKLPELKIAFFDPETRRYDETKVDEVSITVTAAENGAPAANKSVSPSSTPAKNQLASGGLKPIRHQAHFIQPAMELTAQPWFWPLALAPAALSLLAWLSNFVRQRLGAQTPEGLKKQKAQAARKRLTAARKLVGGDAGAFYAEIERALLGFLSARLDVSASSMPREALVAAMVAAGIAELERARIISVLEMCDLGRYAPGMGDAEARRRALEEAATAMESWS